MGWRLVSNPTLRQQEKGKNVKNDKPQIMCLVISTVFSHSDRGSQVLSVAHMGVTFGWVIHNGKAICGSMTSCVDSIERVGN